MNGETLNVSNDSTLRGGASHERKYLVLAVKTTLLQIVYYTKHMFHIKNYYNFRHVIVKRKPFCPFTRCNRLVLIDSSAPSTALSGVQGTPDRRINVIGWGSRENHGSYFGCPPEGGRVLGDGGFFMPRRKYSPVSLRLKLTDMVWFSGKDMLMAPGSGHSSMQAAQNQHSSG
jgi:hypothetical protein